MEFRLVASSALLLDRVRDLRALLLGPALFEGQTLREVDLYLGTVRGLLELVGGFLPDMAQPFVTFWQAHAVIFAILAILLAGLLFSSTLVQRAIGYRMKGLWDGIAGLKPREGRSRHIPERPDLQTSLAPGLIQRTSDISDLQGFPFVFGLVDCRRSR